MIHEIASKVYQLIRQHGGLSAEEVASAIGKQRQVVWRWEGNRQKLLPKRDQEAALVKKAQLTRLAFGEIMCQVLTPFVGRRFIMAPAEEYIPSLPLYRAARLYSRHRDQLDPDAQEMINEMLGHGRMLDAATERTCSSLEKQITRLIEQALAANEKDLSSKGRD